MAREGRLAHQVRAGLAPEETVMERTPPSMVAINGGLNASRTGILDAVSYGKSTRQHVREFGALFATIAFAIAAYRVYHGYSPLMSGIFAVVGVLFAVFGYLAPIVLYPLWKGWMTFAHYLGIVMTSVILGAAWCIMVIPLAVLLKVIGKRVMDMSYDRSAKSYWIVREQAQDFKLLERQF